MLAYLQKTCGSPFTILVVCSLLQLAGKAQRAQPERTPGALVMGSSLTFAAAFPVVKDEPYTANVLTQHIQSTSDGKKNIHEAFNIRMRDSAGRLRDEQLASPPDSQGGFVQAGVQVIDPVAMQNLRWNMDSKTVFVAAIPVRFSSCRQSPILNCALRTSAERAAGSISNPGQSQDVYEDLGERTIQGIRVTGCRITRTYSSKPGSSEPDSVVIETWASPELQINLLTTERYSDGTERLTKLSFIHRTEPDPALFHVPEGYTDPKKVRKAGCAGCES